MLESSVDLKLLLRLQASRGLGAAAARLAGPKLDPGGWCSVDARSTPRTSGFQPGSSVMLSVCCQNACSGLQAACHAGGSTETEAPKHC